MVQSKPDLIDSVFQLLETEYKASQTQKDEQKKTENGTDDAKNDKKSPCEEVDGKQPAKSSTDVQTETDHADVKKKKKGIRKADENPAIKGGANENLELATPGSDDKDFEEVKKKKKKKNKVGAKVEFDNQAPTGKENLSIDVATSVEKVATSAENVAASIEEVAEDPVDGKCISKKKRKKHKQHGVSVGSVDGAESVQNASVTDEVVPPEPAVPQNGGAEIEGDLAATEDVAKSTENLTKKQKKELKKKLKFEAEMKAIELESKTKADEEVPANNEEDRKEKKKKKRKLGEKNDDDDSKVSAKKTKFSNGKCV